MSCVCVFAFCECVSCVFVLCVMLCVLYTTAVQYTAVACARKFSAVIKPYRDDTAACSSYSVVLAVRILIVVNASKKIMLQNQPI